MAWPNLNPFKRDDENTRYTYGYHFQWTTDHYTPEDLKPLMFTYDKLGEDALNALDVISPPPNNALPRRNDYTAKPKAPADGEATTNGVANGEAKGKEPDFTPKRDLYALLKEHHEEDESLGKLWTQINAIPDWVDWDQIARGQEVFYRYGEAALTSLTYQSLLGGMGARRIVETLARTGGFSTKVARHRMFETTQHILQCTNNLDSIKPGGAGHQSTIRVRLLHSAVRRRILKLAKERPSYYNVDELGIPISDLDSIGTIGSFSMTLIWLGLPRQGIFMREQEITDYIALWRYIAYLIGTPDEHFKDAKTAKTIMDSILLYEVNPSEVSQALANNIILSLQGLPPAYASANFLGANTYWLNGSGLSKDLGIPRPPAFYSLLVLGQCLFFCFTSYFYRAIPSLDKRKIRVLRELFWKVIISKEGGLGEETNFDFKYVPEFSVLTTEMGAEKREGLKTKGVERRNFITLLIMGAVFGMGSYWAVNTGMRVLAALRG